MSSTLKQLRVIQRRLKEDDAMAFKQAVIILFDQLVSAARQDEAVSCALEEFRNSWNGQE